MGGPHLSLLSPYINHHLWEPFSRKRERFVEAKRALVCPYTITDHVTVEALHRPSTQGRMHPVLDVQQQCREAPPVQSLEEANVQPSMQGLLAMDLGLHLVIVTDHEKILALVHQSNQDLGDGSLCSLIDDDVLELDAF